MGGVNTDPIAKIANTQSSMADQYKAWGGEDKATSQAMLSQPIARINKLMAGDRSTMADAALPAMSGIESQYKQGRESIYSGVPKGSMQDMALKGAELWKSNAVSSAINAPFTNSFGQAFQLGSALTGQSLGAASGALSGQELAAGAQSDIMNAQAKKKADTLGFVGQMANVAGKVATAGMA